MTALTGGQLTNLRDDHPHVKKTYLSPVLKVPILQAQVDDVGIAVGEMSIDYDTGTGDAAEFALIEAGQTFVLGTTAGANDLGRGRVTSIAGNQVAGTMGASWNSDVEWANNAYLTIYLLYEPWPKFPRFTIAPEVFYKDYGTTYTDENTDQQPIAIMGSGWAGWLNGSVTATLDGRNSYTIAPGAAIVTYAWTVKHNTVGAPIIAAAAASNTTITFDAVGLYWVKLTVTDDNGKVTWTTRPFIVHNTTTNPPVYLEGATRTQNYDSGGATLDFTTREPASDNDIPDLHPVVLWSENYYDTSPADISYLNTFEYVDRTHVDFFGYVVKARPTISTRDLGDVKFNAVTVEGRLKNKFEYPVSLIADPFLTGGVVDAWWKFPNDRLTVARALHHLWEWHSTLHNVADVFYPVGDTRIRAGCEEFTEGSLYDRAATFSYSFGIFAKPVCNIYGALHIEIDVQFLDTADRAAVTDIFTVDGKDWREDIDIEYKQGISLAVVFASGGKWDGNNFTPFCSEFGSVAANDGRGTTTADRLMVSSQANLNELTGRISALANHEIPGISLTMAGNWSSAVGIMPQQWVRLSLTGTEPGNKKGLVLSNIRAIPRNIQTTFNVNGQAGSITTVTLQPEADGRDGQTRNCDFLSDAAPPEPPAPRWSLPSSPTGGTEGGVLGALMAFSSGYYRDDDATIWTAITTDTLLHGNVDPFWRVKQATTNPVSAIWWTVAAGIVARYITTAGARHIVTFGDPPNTWSDGVAPTEFTVDQFQIVGDFWETDRHYVLARWQEAGGLWRGWLAHTADDGATWAWIPLYDGAQPDEVRPLWMAVNGDVVLVTVWQDDGVGGTTLILLEYDKAAMTYTTEYSLGVCTNAQLEVKTYVAYVATVFDDDNDWFVFGRMNAPQALANPEHVIKTINGGAAWSSVKKDWLSNICMSFFAGNDDGGNRVYMAVKGAG